jgi:hypothetical protein
MAIIGGTECVNLNIPALKRKSTAKVSKKVERLPTYSRGLTAPRAKGSSVSAALNQEEDGSPEEFG